MLLMIHCDYNISHIEEIEVGGEVSAEVHGRGGTCFDPPFEYVQDEGIDLDLVLYFTDGEAPLPREENRINTPVLWVVTPGCVAPGGGWSNRYQEPGETVDLEYGHLLVIDA
jgi:predicted metal-dependent peptidase